MTKTAKLTIGDVIRVLGSAKIGPEKEIWIWKNAWNNAN